jgi:predicted anti-sigma-YlaC factor YlaD
MPMKHPWSDRLSEYLDGALSAQETRALEEHLSECATCRQELSELRRVVARLSNAVITQADQPTAREWSAIRRKIGLRSPRWLIPAGLAAALSGIVLSGRAALDRDVDTPLSGYREAVAELEGVLDQSRGLLRPEMVQALEASMAQIDSALAEARQAAKADPGNDYMIRYIDRLHEARIMTLRHAVEVVHLRS